MFNRRKYTIKIDGKEFTLQIEGRDRIILNEEQEFTIDWCEVDPGRFSLLLNGNVYTLTLERMDNGLFVANINGKEYKVEVEDERSRKLKEFVQDTLHQDGPLDINAPMPGLVVEVNVEEGKEISQGDSLLILEAMKMENEIRSPIKGTIKNVNVKAGQAVEKGQPLVTIQIF